MFTPVRLDTGDEKMTPLGIADGEVIADACGVVASTRLAGVGSTPIA
jgi:hypothetical protein